MKSKELIAKELGISRKTLYNYMNALNITVLNDENILIIKKYAKDKNKTKEVSKAFLIEEIERLKIANAELCKKNETLEKGQDVLLQQVEYYRNNIDIEIRQIKQNMILLLNPPKKEKKNLFFKFFKH